MTEFIYYQIPLFLYNYFIVPFVQLLAPIVSLFLPKIKEIQKQQKLIWQRIDDKIKKVSPNQKRIWFQVSSAGEFLQAKPVIEALKKSHPEILIFLTYVSPSTVKWTQNFLALDFVEFYPLDTRKNVKKLLKVIKPDAIVFVKFDLWPNLINEASKLKIPLYLVSATLTNTSKRFQMKTARMFFKHLYDRFSKILTVSNSDLLLFKVTNPYHDGIQVCGDTRTDSVLQRQALFREQPLDASFTKLREFFSPIIVAGSTWPDDEKLLLPVWKKFTQLQISKKAVLILVPHEPTENHLEHLTEKLQQHQLSYAIWSKLQYQHDIDLNSIKIIIFDQVGGLAHLYRIANGAFVGSGQGGVHNTMEPAAWSLPVFFRNTYFNAPEAIALVEQKNFIVTDNESDLFDKLVSIVQSPEKEAFLGEKARIYLEKSQGAATKSAQEILQFLKNSNRNIH